MNFLEIAQIRQSCRSYDANRPVEQEKLDAILQAAQLAPSACNAQPYHITLCRGKAAAEVAAATMGLRKPPLRGFPPVFWVGLTMPKSGRSVIWTALSVWWSRWATPVKEIPSVPKSARSCPSWSVPWSKRWTLSLLPPARCGATVSGSTGARICCFPFGSWRRKTVSGQV